MINVITFFLLILVRRLIFQQILKYCPMKVLIHRLLINLTLFQAGGLFGQPPTSIRHDFFLVTAMELKFSIASQLVIRKILPKYFQKNMCHYGIMTHFERLCAVFQLVYIVVIVAGFVCFLSSMLFIFDWC